MLLIGAIGFDANKYQSVVDQYPQQRPTCCGGTASQEGSHNARARMLRAEGIRMPGSKEAIASFADSIGFRVWVFLRSIGNVGLWFTPACLKIAEQRLLLLYQLSYAWTLVVIGTTARYTSVLSRFSSLWSRVCLWGQSHVSAFYTLCLL